MDGTEIADQIKKAKLYEAIKQALMRVFLATLKFSRKYRKYC